MRPIRAMVDAPGVTCRVTPGADKNYDTRGCVDVLRCANATPHVAQNTSNRSSAIDGRTSRHPGHAMSQRFRKRIGECSGWARVIGGMRKSRLVGREKLDFPFVLTMSAYTTWFACTIRGWRYVDGRAPRVWCAWKQANRTRLANFRPEGRSHCASFAAGCQKGPFSRVIFNGLLEIVR